jgi:hypothetical protein
MKLIDLFTDLTYGELSNLHLGGFSPYDSQSEPDPIKYAQLIAAVNMGLNQLYKEFFLRSEEHYILLNAAQSTYKLHSDYAQTNTGSPIAIGERYIQDTADNPFQDNVLRIEEVYDEDGVKLPLNDETEDLSVYTPNYNTLQVPYPEDDMTIAVQFRAGHPKIVFTGVGTFVPEDVEIELPNGLKEALQFYVASRLLRPFGGERTLEADNYFQLYKDSVRIAKDEGLEVQGEVLGDKFEDRGWL